jgi:hypothetical protein
VVEPGHAGVPAGDLAVAVQLLDEHRGQDVVDERRLARAGHAGDRDELAERERDRDVAQVVLAGADDRELATLRAGPAHGGTAISRRPDRYMPVMDSSEASRSCTGPLTTTWPPCSPAPGPMSTTQSATPMVSSSCSTTMRVLPSSLSRSRVSMSRPVVALVQADRRLVEHVEHADQAGADLGGQPDALRLAAGQRGAARSSER